MRSLIEIFRLTRNATTKDAAISIFRAIFVALLLGLPTSVMAALASHIGSNDPLTEGWTLKGQEFLIDIGPVDDSGVPAWQVNDRNNSRFLNYAQELTSEQHETARTNGWILRANLRILNLNDAPEAAVVITYSPENVNDFSLGIGSDEDGDPRLQLFENISGPITGPSLTLEGLGGGFHLYEMIYDPASETVDLWVDGIERISNYAGRVIASSNSVAWGSGSSADTGGANYNLVEFTVVPIPAAIWLLLGGIVFLFRAASNDSLK